MFLKNGIIVVNKPTGMSSNLPVQIVKRVLKPNKIGHLGTLDPLGSGVLLLTINKATKLFEKYLTKNKTYIAVFKFGAETDTLDSEGNIINSNDVKVSLQDVKEISKQFVGEFDQMPPVYSAKKINGKKAYELAREGKEVVLKTRRVSIYSCEVLKELEQNTFLFKIECGGGTYIRSICRDIAAKLNTFATMTAIVRTVCGDFNIEQSSTIEEIKEGNYTFFEMEE